MGTGSNVIVGVAILYIAPSGTSSPALPSTHGTSTWPTPFSPWVQSGFTESGVTFNIDRKTDLIRVEEQSTPVSVVNDTTDVTVDISFAEDTIANMVYAYGGGTVTTTAASSGVPGNTQLALSDTLSTVAVLFYGANPYSGCERQVYIPEMVATGKVKTDYKRTKTARSYPVTFEAISPMPNILITDITAASI